ncbi:MAG: hypothetical protein AB1530_06415 [Candidatus Omnitrophota bacterium]
MKKGMVAVLLFAAVVIFLSGCKSVRVGATGQVGSVKTSGDVSVPLPKTK